MNINLIQALTSVKLAVGETAQKAEKRKLVLYGDKIPCKTGCSSCCSRLLHITIAEAVVIYDTLRDNAWPYVAEEARKQFKLVKETNSLNWFKMNISCPILDPITKKCRSYDSRPPVCSTHFVTSNPKVCDPWDPTNLAYEPVRMSDLLLEFEKKVSSVVDGHGVMQIKVPIPIAILIAERISVQSSLSLHDAISLLYNEFR